MAKRKPLAPFRVPRGVPSAIRRQLRLGKPGRFLSTVKALQLHDLLAWESKQAKKTHNRLAGVLSRSKRPEVRAKYLGALRGAQERHGALQHGLDQLAESSGFEPLPPLASPGVVPIATHEEEESEDYALKEEGALEIEFGVDYVEAEGWYHPEGRASDVSFNARIFRRDGWPLTESDARDIAAEFAQTGNMRRGIEVRTVRWARADGIERGHDGNGISSNRHDLADFLRILRRVGDSGLRIGPVKPDTL